MTSTNPNKQDIIAYTKQLFGDDSFLPIIACESGFNTYAKNPNSTASGLAEFINSTWVTERKRMGRDPSLDLKSNWIENIETAYYTVKHDGIGHWSSSRPCWISYNGSYTNNI